MAGDREREYIFRYVRNAPLEREDARQRLLSLFEAYCIRKKIGYGTPLCGLVVVSIYNNVDKASYETEVWHNHYEFCDFLGRKMKDWEDSQ